MNNKFILINIILFLLLTPLYGDEVYGPVPLKNRFISSSFKNLSDQKFIENEFIFKLHKGKTKIDLMTILKNYRITKIDSLGLDMYLVKFSDKTSFETAQSLVETNKGLLIRVGRNHIYKLMK